jgi:hypothetical protein
MQKQNRASDKIEYLGADITTEDKRVYKKNRFSAFWLRSSEEII